MKLEDRVTTLEAEVKLLKEMFLASLETKAGPQGPPGPMGPVSNMQCGCPMWTGPHDKGFGCLDSWATCAPSIDHTSIPY